MRDRAIAHVGNGKYKISYITWKTCPVSKFLTQKKKFLLRIRVGFYRKSKSKFLSKVVQCGVHVRKMKTFIVLSALKMIVSSFL